MSKPFLLPNTSTTRKRCIYFFHSSSSSCRIINWSGEIKRKEREKREVPVPKTHLERIGLAVSGGREVEDTPLGEPGDGVYSVS